MKYMVCMSDFLATDTKIMSCKGSKSSWDSVTLELTVCSCHDDDFLKP